jgi:hypothetical protein
MNRSKIRRVIHVLAASLASALVVLCAACQGERQDLEAADSAHHDHHHAAPHGGLLVEIGNHAANLEFVLDAEAGLLTAYVMDGCAENAVRIAQPAIELSVTLPPQNGQAGPRTIEVVLDAIANPLTGEIVGDTSQFAVVVPELIGRRFFAAVIGDLDILGTETTGVDFFYLEDAEEQEQTHDH